MRKNEKKNYKLSGARLTATVTLHGQLIDARTVSTPFHGSSLANASFSTCSIVRSRGTRGSRGDTVVRMRASPRGIATAIGDGVAVRQSTTLGTRSTGDGSRRLGPNGAIKRGPSAVAWAADRGRIIQDGSDSLGHVYRRSYVSERVQRPLERRQRCSQQGHSVSSATRTPKPFTPSLHR